MTEDEQFNAIVYGDLPLHREITGPCCALCGHPIDPLHKALARFVSVMTTLIVITYLGAAITLGVRGLWS